MRLSGNRTLPVGVPDNDICVWADRYHSLSRIQIEDLSGIGAGHCHEPRRIHYSRVYTFLPNDWHPVFHAVYTIGNLRKVIFAQSFLFGVEGAIVATGNLKAISGEIEQIV